MLAHDCDNILIDRLIDCSKIHFMHMYNLNLFSDVLSIRKSNNDLLAWDPLFRNSGDSSSLTSTMSSSSSGNILNNEKLKLCLVFLINNYTQCVLYKSIIKYIIVVIQISTFS